MSVKSNILLGVFAGSVAFSSLSFSAPTENAVTVKKADENESQAQQHETTSLKFAEFSKKFWGLNKSEWERYQQVKELARQLGKTPVESTPPEVLAIFAQNDAERRRYAQIFAKKYDLYVNMLLATNSAISEVQAEMYANQPMLDPERINELRNAPLRTSDRIQYFTRVENCLECEVVLRKLIRQVRLYGAKLDLFVTGESSDDTIQKFAKEFLPEELVTSGKITINRDMGFTDKHSITVPKPFVSRSGGPLEVHDPEI